MEKKYQCRQCNQMLSHNMYYRDDRTATGLKGICKQCLKENYEANREKRIQYQLEWNANNYEKVKEYMARYQHRKSNFVTA